MKFLTNETLAEKDNKIGQSAESTLLIKIKYLKSIQRF